MSITIEMKMSGKSVGADLQDYLQSVSYREALDGEADTLEVTLHDIKGLFMSSWFPSRGTMIEIILNDGEQLLPLGDFYVDEIENSVPPSECKIKGTSIPPQSTVKAAEKWRSWEHAKLRQIAEDIAQSGGLKVYYEADYDPTLDRAEQSDESDLKFLHRLCKDNGLALKLNDKQLIIFDIERYEKAAPVLTIEKGASKVKRFSARSTLNEIYSACEVKYDDGDSKKIFVGQSAGGLISKLFKGSGKKLKVNKRVSNAGEADRLARKKLKEKNRKETKVQLTMMGSFYLRAGATVTLKNFAVFDGKYLIQKATHTVGSGGYETAIEISKVN